MKKNRQNSKSTGFDAMPGLQAAPPNASILDAGFTVLQDKVIIIADKPTALRMLQSCRDMGSLPS